MKPAVNKDISNEVYHEAQDNMKLLPNYYSWIFSKFKKYLNGDVVELGVGDGHIISNYVHNQNVNSVLAVDFNEILLERLKNKNLSAKINFLKLDLRDIWTDLEDASADCSIALDVLEHFEDDKLFVNKINKSLKKGGYSIIKVPAQSKLFSSVDESSGHYRRYDLKVLEDLMKDAGFKVVELNYFNFFGSLLYPMKKNKNKNFSKTFKSWKIKLANTIIPLIASMDFIPQSKGLSLIGVFQKQ